MGSISGSHERQAWDVKAVEKGNGGGGSLFCLLPEMTWEQFLEVGICRSLKWKPFVFIVRKEKVQY